MPSQDLQAVTVLCQRLLFSSFGDEVGAVGAVLLERGRLTLRQLRNLCQDIPVTHLARCLGVLIQQNCVFHSVVATEEAYNEDERSEEYFEASHHDILDRLRLGRVIALHRSPQMTRDENIPEALALPLVETLLLHGKMKLRHLLDSVTGQVPNGPAVKDEHGPGNKIALDRIPNGHFDPKGKGRASTSATRSDYANVIRLMLQKRFFRIVTPRQMMSSADRDMLRERELYRRAREAYGRTPSQQQIKKIRREMLNNETVRSQAKEESDEEYEAAVLGSKRKAIGNLEERPSHGKRFRADIELNEECHLKINVDRYMLHVRDAQIRNTVRARYGAQVRDIMTAALLAVKEDLDHDPGGPLARSASVSTAQICRHLKSPSREPKRPRKPVFVDSCAMSRGRGDRSGTWRRPVDDEGALVREVCEMLAGPDADEQEGDDEDKDDDDADETLSRLRRQRRRPWLRRVHTQTATRAGQERWRIDFGALSSTIKYALFEDIIRRRFGDRGDLACRLVNLVAVGQDMDDKQLAKAALMPAKEVRALLSELGSQRLLESQETPRSKTDRSRSIFSYYVDPASWQTVLLGEVYQALGNLTTRANEELLKSAQLLARLERPDVAGDIRQLTENDQQEMAQLNMRLEFLETAMARTDEDRYLLEMVE